GLPLFDSSDLAAHFGDRFQNVLERRLGHRDHKLTSARAVRASALPPCVSKVFLPRPRAARSASTDKGEAPGEARREGAHHIREYRWDQQNRLVRFLQGTHESVYEYDGESHRVRIGENYK